MLLGASGSSEVSTGFFSKTIGQSLRVNQANDPFLSHDHSASADDEGTCTISLWVKRSKLGSNTRFMGVRKGTNYGYFGFESDDKLAFFAGNPTVINFITTRLFRDPSAWYHIVVALDIDNATSTERFKMYVNGVQETSFATATYPTSTNAYWNEASAKHSVGCGLNSAGDHFQEFDGYIAEVNFIDGVVLDPSSFGETKDGVWVPKNYSGSYGDEGFHLTFQGTGTATTSQDTTAQTNIGDDQSGNGNNFEIIGSSIVSTDVVPDSPTNSFAILNVLNSPSTAITTSLAIQRVGLRMYGAKCHTRSSIAVSSGKWYWEANINAEGTGTLKLVGVVDADFSAAAAFLNSAIQYGDDGKIYTGTSATTTGLATYTTDDVIGVALDLDAGTPTVSFYKNNSLINTTNLSGISGATTWQAIFGFANSTNLSSMDINFGQDSIDVSSAESDANGIGTFEYAPPSGHLALCTSNLPDPTIGPGQDTQADDNFNTLLYSGDGNTSRSITGVGFAPDLVFIKSRSTAEDSAMSDTVRGASKKLKPNKGDAESTPATAVISAFGSDGFTGPASTPGNLNVNTRTYVAWNWKAGGAPSADNSAAANAEPTAGSAKIDGSNQSGAFSGPPSIAIKRLSANTAAGFSIVTWTGTGSAGTIPHGLGVAPDFYVVKNRDDASTSWQAYHRSIASDAETDYIYLNDTAGAGDSDDWNDTAPTANVFSVKTHNQVNESGDDYLAYVFASIEGYSKFGSFSGNSASDGTFVYLGFRPAYIWLKRHDSGGVDWSLYDNKREGYNVDNDNLRAFAFSAATEQTDNDIDFLSNGFKCRRNFANNQGSVLYFAWADQPFKFSNAR
jgi:hypothetical protein